MVVLVSTRSERVQFNQVTICFISEKRKNISVKSSKNKKRSRQKKVEADFENSVQPVPRVFDQIHGPGEVSGREQLDIESAEAEIQGDR